MNLFAKISKVFKSIDDSDGRIVKLTGLYEPTEEEKADALRIAKQRETAMAYLLSRDKCVLTSNTFKYVPSLKTNIRVTMRNFIIETMPESRNTYEFLFV